MKVLTFGSMGSYIYNQFIKYYNPNVHTNIKLCIFDFDGTLTDGKVLIDSNGHIAKLYNVQDGKGLKTILKEHNIKTCIITGYSQNESVEIIAKRLNIDYLYQDIDNKLEVINKLLQELNLTYENVTYMGDDVNDIDLLKNVKIAACPKNAVLEVKKVCTFLCERNGGDGAAREFIDYCIAHN